MASDSTGLIDAPSSQRRVIGRVRAAAEGPTVVVVGGIHGNEPSGVSAARRVLVTLQGLVARTRGEVIFLAGNLTALADARRFVDLDLNRIWTPERVDGLRRDDPNPEGPVELVEQRALLQALERIVEAARGPVHFLDLHTSSADGAPFVTVGDTLRNRAFARCLPLPLILGLEEQVDGALLEFLNNFGVVTMGVEGGQHDAPSSIDHHESVIWLALVAAGSIAEGVVPDIAMHRERLQRASRGVPRVVEVRHRKEITPEDRFRMEAGFANFQPVERGKLLAHDRSGTVRAPATGLILLPLYQGQGNDGFFISREVREIWLWVSELLRRLRFGALIRFLPGVRRSADNPQVLEVNTRVARWYPLEIFHLLGFRKLRETDQRLMVSRRRYDLDPPRRVLIS